MQQHHRIWFRGTFLVAHNDEEYTAILNRLIELNVPRVVKPFMQLTL